MDQVCLLVDIDETGLVDTWQDALKGIDLPLAISYAGIDDVKPMMETGTVVAMVIFASDLRNELFTILDLYKQHVGVIASFQAIVCDDPHPLYMTQVFEYGIENFFTVKNWSSRIVGFCEEIKALLSDKESSESQIIHLSQSTITGDHSAVEESKQNLSQMADYDFLAAYSTGAALQAVGRFDEAVDVLKKSQTLNKLFRPSISKMGENLMILGKTDEAIKIFNDLEKLNKRNVERKAFLAAAHLEKGDITSAKKYLLEAEAFNPNHPLIAETKVQLLLKQGKIKAAFAQLDGLSDVGPFFAAKLNEMGIRLSQQGKGKSALALYQKAHRIVKAELKYKISLNAALACYRMKELQLALKYLNRCEREFGEETPKVKKIRAAIRSKLNLVKSAS